MLYISSLVWTLAGFRMGDIACLVMGDVVYGSHRPLGHCVILPSVCSNIVLDVAKSAAQATRRSGGGTWIQPRCSLHFSHPVIAPGAIYPIIRPSSRGGMLGLEMAQEKSLPNGTALWQWPPSQLGTRAGTEDSRGRRQRKPWSRQGVLGEEV